MSAPNLPKDSEIDQPLSNYSVVDSPFSTTPPTKKLANKTSVLNVRYQGEQRDVSDLKSLQGTSEDHEQINELPTKPIHNGLFYPILLHLDTKLVISQKFDQGESYNLVCW